MIAVESAGALEAGARVERVREKTKRRRPQRAGTDARDYIREVRHTRVSALDSRKLKASTQIDSRGRFKIRGLSAQLNHDISLGKKFLISDNKTCCRSTYCQAAKLRCRQHLKEIEPCLSRMTKGF